MRTSLRARVVYWLLGLVARMRGHRAISPGEARRAMNAVRSLPNWKARYRAASAGGIGGEWATGASAAGTLLYLHGGGYIAMSPRTHRAITGAFAARGFRTFAPDYRLAPEHPFPAALDDAVAAYMALTRETTGPLFLAGDSAGGGLALALLLRLRDAGHAMPAAAVLFSPWTDLAVTGASIGTNASRDPVFDPAWLPVIAAQYCGRTDPRDPFVSPVYGTLAGLPPLQIFAGESEILLDDSRRVAERARAAGVRTELHVWPSVPHVWQLMAGLVPEANRSLDMAAKFFRSCEATGR